MYSIWQPTLSPAFRECLIALRQIVKVLKTHSYKYLNLKIINGDILPFVVKLVFWRCEFAEGLLTIYNM